MTASAQITTKKYFYGDKARNSRTNPCKGNTDQICAVFETTTPGLTDDWTITLPGVGFSLASTCSTTQPITVWRVPMNVSDSEFQSIKTLEYQYSDLRVVRGLEEEATDDDETE